MKKNYMLLLTGCLFFLTLTYFSIWWLALAALAGIGCVAYRAHRDRIDRMEAGRVQLEMELLERAEQLERELRLGKNLRRKIEEIQHAKTVLLNKISHDIRTPLNGMLGMASLLGQTPLSKEQGEYIGTISGCGKKMITTINDILLKDMLDHPLGQNGKIALEQNDFNIRGCIQASMDFFSAKAETAGIEMLYQVDYDVPEQVIGDEGRLRQILLNLLGNAVKNTDSGEILVRLSLGETAKNEELCLAFEVRDSGRGMAVGKLTKIRSILSGPGPSGADQAEDTGLGLIITDKLIAAMGGNLVLESSTAEGTVVSFNIKMSRSASLQKRGLEDNIRALEGKKILLAIHNPAMGRLLFGHLGHGKLDPTLTYSGKDALAVLSGAKIFDLVIVDSWLADVDGIELSRKIRHQHPGIPLILVDRSNDREHPGHAGLFQSILHRPSNERILYDQLIAAFGPQGPKKTNEQNGPFQLSDKFSLQYPLRIIIAEDDPLNQLFAVKILDRLGYRPDVAIDGKEVLEMVSLKRYDLILMDVEMPTMDGLEATRMIRLCLESQPVIIAMTANALQGDRETCIRSGMDDYLSKPVDLEKLVHILEKWALRINEKR